MKREPYAMDILLFVKKLRRTHIKETPMSALLAIGEGNLPVTRCKVIGR